MTPATLNLEDLLSLYKNYVYTFYAVTDTGFNTLTHSFTHKVFKKGDLLLKEGEECKYFWFIGKGCLRIFKYKEGEEINTRFFFENSLASDFVSLREGTPSEYNIVAMEDCVVLCAYRQLYKSVFDLSMELIKLAMAFYQQCFFDEIKHSNSFKILTPAERYSNLLANHPEYFQRLSLTHIASYLGISRKTLNRIRNIKR